MKNSFEKILLFVSATLLLLLCFALFSLYQKINDNDQKTQQDVINLQTETNQRNNLMSLNQVLKKSASDRTLLESHFINGSDIVPFLDIIEKLAQQAGALAQIDSVNTQTDNTGLVVELKALGKFEAIYKFLILLENSPYVLDFMSMDMHKLSSPPVVPGKNVESASWEVAFKIQLLSFIP
jgi:hypothetical protein